MAGLTSLRLYRLVLEYERPLLVRVTFEANSILRRGCPHLFGGRRAVHVVAITALHQSFIHSMVEWHVKLSFLLEMARVAKLGLRLDK